MDKLCKFIDKELDEYENKVAMGGRLSRTEIEDGKNLAKFKMALLTNEAMERDSDYSNEYRDGNMNNRGSYRSVSYARGRGSNARRDSMGRYSREDGYSRAEAEDEFRDRLEEAMESAPDEHKRKKLERILNEM
jgi:hypothetical protein